jgi:hypothetical protein
LGGKIQVAFDVGRVHHVYDDVGVAGKDKVAGDHLVQRVSA